MYKVRYTTFLVAFLLSGCATTGEKFSTVGEPNISTALLYVYRPSTPPYLLTPTIKVNNVEVAELANKGFFEIYLASGKYTIHSDWSPLSGVPDGKLTFNMTAGETYFVLVSTNTSLADIITVGSVTTPVFETKGNIGLVHADVALNQIASCSRIEIDDPENILIKPNE